MIQCKSPVTPWCNNLSLAGKRPVRIKLPLTQIQYLHKVPGFCSAGHKCQLHHTQLLISFTNATFQLNLDLFSYRYTPTHLKIAHLFLLPSLRREKNLAHVAEIVHYHERHFRQEVAMG